mmetsp:Transcript_29854/g.41290  ORF Transcript_29854/g.41290 Transcript_29854/m.41290 type:complete len:472 (+) Transcript_29854:51-1466(+)|eukprot:CAMPEP_0196579890 /NCGR_PEP_ID=MMETSP1081-20130531/25548_1 /TAXON_ID=36882 /ORGANISM="Pyramimonas amylifera, Strain CCMP720" /LENGTH=471 /DNA_ID=CAMNT_0041899605 /DNA_START=38 /DNA_END=1453 /DNA_ORIENTATION=-
MSITFCHFRAATPNILGPTEYQVNSKSNLESRLAKKTKHSNVVRMPRTLRGVLNVVSANNGNGNGDGNVTLAGTVVVNELNLSTTSVHAGERSGRPSVADSLTTPLVQSSTYFFKDSEQLIAYQEGRYESYEYGRYGNPTSRVVEEKLRILEGGEDCLVSSSGMCAATTMLLALVPPGGHILTTTDCYRRTRQFIQTVLPKMGITVSVVDPADVEGMRNVLESRVVSLFFSESPTNPYLRCIDVATVSDMCHAHGCVVCIDGTFATPINQRPITQGADLVLHSATKYLAGHNDVLAGALVGSKSLVGEVRKLHHVLGGVIDSHAAYMVLRGMKTLELRVTRQNETALKLARRLELHPKIDVVHYPGLKSHPEHKIAKGQMSGFGGVLSFEVKADLMTTAKFIDACRLPYIAPSLGAVETLIEQPTIVSYWDKTPEERAQIGIKDNLVRFACGIEDYGDIEADVLQALDQIP